MSPYNYFPVTYQNPYMQNFQQQPQMQQQQPQPQQQPQQLNGGYVTVRSEEEARNYPVAPGASVTFFNETQPFCYKKSAGTSPLDPPTFEIYQITKVESVKKDEPTNITPKTEKSQIEAILSDLEALEKRVSEIENKKEVISDVKSIDKQGE